MQIRKFRPGELICRMSKRSQLNDYFVKQFEDTSDNLQDEMQVNIIE